MNLATSGGLIVQRARSRASAGATILSFLLGSGLSFIASAEPTAYTLNNDADSTIVAVFDCSPNFSGKAGLGDNKYAYVWECEHNTDSKYAIYKTSYTSRFDLTLSSQKTAEEFFAQFLASKVSSYQNKSRMSDLSHAILLTNYSSTGVAYADYLIIYNWDNIDRMAQQGRLIFNNGYIADWSVVGLMKSGVAADEFNSYVKYFQIKIR